jgi:hypothetical protein
LMSQSPPVITADSLSSNARGNTGNGDITERPEPGNR